MTESENPPTPADFWAQIERRYQEAAEAKREEVAALCEELQQRGIREVRLEYNGFGDSGMIESVLAFGDDEESAVLDNDEQALLTEHAENLLPPGWENDEGAWGVIVLDVAQRKVTRQHNWRIESSEYEEEEYPL